MRRRAELERFEKEAKFVASFLRGESEDIEDPRLNVASMDSDRAAADLGSIQHEIIGLRAYPFGMGLEQLKIFVHRGSERMMPRDPAVFGGIEFQERKINDPQHVPLPRRNPVLLLRQFETERAKQIQSGFLRTRHQKDRIALCCSRLLNDRLDSGCACIPDNGSRGDAIISQLDPSHTRPAQLFHKKRDVIECFSRIRCFWRDESADGLSSLCHFSKNAGRGSLEDTREVLEKDIETRIRFIAPVAAHGFLETEARKRPGNSDAI